MLRPPGDLRLGESRAIKVLVEDHALLAVNQLLDLVDVRVFACPEVAQLGPALETVVGVH